MKHFFLPAGMPGKEIIVLKGKDYHYLKNVRRLKTGDTFTGIDAGGRMYRLEIRSENPGELVADCCLFESPAREESVQLVLYQALLKGKKLDSVVRQATEAGIGKFVPLLSEHTIARIDKEGWQHKRERWERIAREALQQSGRLKLPEIGTPCSINDLKGLEGSKLLFHQEEAPPEASLHRYLAGEPEVVHLVIGPEGGFSGSEVVLLEEFGFKTLNLGQNVLRAETAALFAVAAVRMILLERKFWRLN